MRRRLLEQGFKCCRPVKKPRLTETMKKKRLEWAKSHRHMTTDDWKNVMLDKIQYYLENSITAFIFQVCFSDESTFQILTDKSSFVRRRPGEKYHKDCIVERVKHPFSIMVWSIISGKGTGRLYIVEGTMRQDQYINVLRTRMLPQVREWFPNGENFSFMHDSAPCHKARRVTAYLETQNINVLQWPGNSPDMNAIENLWELTKREISKEIITNKQQLIEKLISVWHHDERIKENALKCIESMPRRIEAVIAAKGDVTKY